MYGELKVFSGSSNRPLVEKICEKLGINVGPLTIKQFSDGEIWVRFEESIRGKDVFIIQSTNSPAENYMELLLILDAARRASAARITAVLPYYGYARQDRKDQPRVPISARLFMDLLVKAGADRIMAMDLHSTQIQGYVDVPFDHLYSRPALLEHCLSLSEDTSSDLVVVAPDMGSVHRTRSYAGVLNRSLAIIDKRRTSHNQSEVMHLIGEVKGKRALIVDDMCDTAGTLVAGARRLKDLGALDIYAMFTHPVLSGEAIERIKDSPINQVITTDTIYLPEEKRIPKIEVVSVADIFAEAIQRTNNEDSISVLFR
ncbi:TPA: ribose-phosphate diphosphokinase [Candidatus Marinimicrobia bacterium]|nr:MAG: Ribose-phosphate pyrophosphokinase [Marinimicrobia bacterium 46_47]KUK91517.1 MAG: Phosphoribosylpyrophosphate synthetase [Marinimicrobia bacterium 46_43]HAE87068.1 ribose-phosphate diphosphokinase [Candidatus Neomarinimicrobiota bacterium]HBY18497.1 ribose-phosphate diphosphokinase [Candidatus Neomarinimicrobiota bacterium]